MMDAVSVGFVPNLDQAATAMSMPTHRFSDWVKVMQTLFSIFIAICAFIPYTSGCDLLSSVKEAERSAVRGPIAVALNKGVELVSK